MKVINALIFVDFVDKDTLKELRGMMKDSTLSTTELKEVENTIKAVEKGDMKKRVQKLREMRVLGTT